jgi:hypothetical protein
VEGWGSVDISCSEEEQRWLSEGGRTDEADPEEVGNLTLGEAGPLHSSTTKAAKDAVVRGLTWRLRIATAEERNEQELHVARRIQQALLPERVPARYSTRWRPRRVGYAA